MYVGGLPVTCEHIFDETGLCFECDVKKSPPIKNTGDAFSWLVKNQWRKVPYDEPCGLTAIEWLAFWENLSVSEVAKLSASMGTL